MSYSIFVAKELEQKLNVVVEEQYPENLIMRTGGASIFPFRYDLNPDEPKYTYEIVTGRGVAEFLVNGGDDLPTGSLSVEEREGYLKDIGFSFSYTDRELNLAVRKSKPLKTMHLSNAKRAHDRKLEDIYYEGAPDHNLYGILNFPGIPVETLLPDGAGSSTTIASKTPEQKYRDLTQMVDRMGERSKGVFYPEILMLSIEVFNDFNRTLLPNNGGGGRTILQVFMDNQALNPRGIKRIIPNPYLSGKGTGGTDLALLYTRDPKYLECILPSYLEVTPESEIKNYKLVVNTRSSVGGVVVYHPLSVSIVDGL